MRLTPPTAVVLVLVAFPMTLVAQTETPGDPTISTNISGVRIYKPLPAEFFVQASPTELERYGVPLEPSRTQVQAHLDWENEIQISRSRIIPDLLQTNVYHKPAQKVVLSPSATSKVVPGTSENWSGYVISDSTKPFSKGITLIGATYVMPRALCEGKVLAGSYYSSAWVGLDGYPLSDVLQAGTEADVSCPGRNSPGQASNYVWIEWFPLYAIRVNLPVSPGDLIGVRILAYGSPTIGKFSIMNWTTNQSVQGTIDHPPGITNLVGDSAEWIVEVPAINDKPANLADYGTVVMKSAFMSYTPVGASTIRLSPGQLPAGNAGRIYNLTLTEPANSNASVATVFSTFPEQPTFLPDVITFIHYDSQFKF